MCEKPAGLGVRVLNLFGFRILRLVLLGVLPEELFGFYPRMILMFGVFYLKLQVRFSWIGVLYANNCSGYRSNSTLGDNI